MIVGLLLTSLLIKGIQAELPNSPEVHNLICESRDLSVLECYWRQGRDKNLRGRRKTKYFLNGRPCLDPIETHQQQHKCSTEIPASQGEVVWTLVAQNDINKTSFNYTVNPRHRVYLPAPQGLHALDVKSTTASLRWHWPDGNLMSLPMQCQVQIMWPNQLGPVREETGVGLHFVKLYELHPYTSYKGQVRCASAEYFWKWGDWSEKIPFRTKEDIPQAVDVWMTADSSNRTFVVWKKLTAEQCHGRMREYRLSWGDTVKTLNPTQHCHNMSTDSVVKATITAVNTAGHSPPSTIMTPSQPTDVKTTRVTGSEGSLELSWDSGSGTSCGYVLDWHPVGSQDKCGIEWIKIPAGRNSARINSGLEDGVRYAFSLYACISSDAPELLRRWEGYAQERAPDKSPSYLHAERFGYDVILTWDEIPLENQRGFIQGYLIKYCVSSDDDMGQNKTIVHTFKQKKSDKGMQERIPNLFAESYVFWISAFTSGGEGPAIKYSFSLSSHSHHIIVHIIILLGLVIEIAALVSILCYQRKTR